MNSRKLRQKLFFSGAKWRRLVRRGIHGERRKEFRIACFLRATKLGLHLFFSNKMHTGLCSHARCGPVSKFRRGDTSFHPLSRLEASQPS